MKILFISMRLPHPRVGSGHMIVHQRIQRLAKRGHQVGLVVFEQEDDADHVPEIRGVLHELEIVPRPRRSLGDRVNNFLFSRVPPRFAEYRSDEMRRRVGDMVERTPYDVVVAEFGLMGQYVHWNPYLPAVRKVISVHQCHTLAARKALETLGWSPIAFREWFALQRLQRFELDMYRSADRIVVLTAEARYSVLSYAPDLRVSMIPSGVDTDYYRPGDPAKREHALLFTGYYRDEPNRDAVLWFVHTVWPTLKAQFPELVFYVVGPEPTAAIRELAAKSSGIIVTGEVDDIRPYLNKARVFVCPNRIGSGMRGKILQAMASGVPVVATSLGAEGIPIQMGDTGFLADKPEILAQSIKMLLTDEVLHGGIAQRARAMMVERFSWDQGVRQFENILEEVVSGR